MNGSVRRVPSGRWEYRFDLPPDPLSGKRRIQSRAGFLTRREAAKALRDAIRAAETGRSVRATRRTVDDYLQEWLPAVKASLRATTWTNYMDYCRAYVIPAIGQSRLADLTPVRLNLLYAHLLEHGRVRGPGGLAPKTVQNIHRMLHRALSDAVRWDYLPRNVAEDASPPRVSRYQPTIWTTDQLRVFIEHVQGDRYFALWLLVATTGLRRGELAGLRALDIDFDRARVSPQTPRVVVAGRAQTSEPKTRTSIRTLSLDPATLDALRHYVAAREREAELVGTASGVLFAHLDGRPLHPDTITAMFHRHCADAGLPRIRLHDVRHSYATAALQAGVPAKVVSERLGHANVAFTLQTYTHVIAGMDQQAARQVADLIVGPRPELPQHAVRDFVRDRAIEAPQRD